MRSLWRVYAASIAAGLFGVGMYLLPASEPGPTRRPQTDAPVFAGLFGTERTHRASVPTGTVTAMWRISDLQRREVLLGGTASPARLDESLMGAAGKGTARVVSIDRVDGRLPGTGWCDPPVRREMLTVTRCGAVSDPAAQLLDIGSSVRVAAVLLRDTLVTPRRIVATIYAYAPRADRFVAVVSHVEPCPPNDPCRASLLNVRLRPTSAPVKDIVVSLTARPEGPRPATTIYAWRKDRYERRRGTGRASRGPAG